MFLDLFTAAKFTQTSITRLFRMTRALNLRQEAEDQGLSFDELVKKANKQIEADIDSLGFGIVTNSLGYKDLFNMIAEGNMTKEEISNAMKALKATAKAQGD